MEISNGNSDDNWLPPSVAEMKILEARRERSDKISKVLGQYLLKGYKMLSHICDECGVCPINDVYFKLVPNEQIYCLFLADNITRRQAARTVLCSML